MNKTEFFNHLERCMSGSPILTKHIKQALIDTMGELASREEYEHACDYRDMIRFMDNDLPEKIVDPECPCD